MALPIISGIYGIVHAASGRVYIGSSEHIHIRWRNHRNMLRRGCHDNIHLQRAWDKYGADAFEWRVIETCQPSELLTREQHWIDKLDGRGYNLRPAFCPPTPRILDEARVIAIKARIAKGERLKDIACDERVHPATISRIAKGLCWAHVRASEEVERIIAMRKQGEGESNPRARLTRIDVAKIKRRLAAGEHAQSIAADFPVGAGTVWRIKQGRIWQSVSVD